MNEELTRRLSEAAGEHHPPDARHAILARLNRRRRRRRAVAAAAVAVVAAAIGIPAGLLAGGSAPGPTRLSTAGRGGAGAPTGSGPAATGSVRHGSATTTTSAPQPVTAQATASLDAFVAAEVTRYEARSAAAAGGPQASPTTQALPWARSVHIAPVPNDGGLVALAAFGLPGGPGPVQVLGYRSGGWSVTANLPMPSWPPAAPANGLPIAREPVQVADVTGQGHPSFLVMLMAADNTPGFVVAEQNGRWGYVTFNGPYPPSDVVGRNPSFVNGRLVSQYDDCSPDCAAGHTYDVVWTFRPGPGDFWAPNPPGWTAPAGAENSAAGPGQGSG